MTSLEEECIFNRDGQCYFLESKISTCTLCFNFKTFTRYGNRRKAYYNLFDYLKSNDGDVIFPRGNDEQETLR